MTFHVSPGQQQRGAVGVLRGAIALSLVVCAVPLGARELESVDALADAQPFSRAPSPASSAVADVQHDAQLGVPMFLSAKAALPKQSGSMLLVSRPEQVARNYLKSVAAEYRISTDEIDDLDVFDSQRLDNGAALVRFNHRVDGIEVFREEASVLINADGALNSIGGFVSGSVFSGDRAFSRQPTAALGIALQDFGVATNSARASNADASHSGDYVRYTVSDRGAGGEALKQPARLKAVWFRLPDGLVPAYYIEVNVDTTDGDASYAYVISAQDDRVLFRHNQTSDFQTFSYRVWAEPTAPYLPYPGPQGRNGTPHPTGQPDGYQAPFVEPNLITLINAIQSPTSVAINDPWLAATATETIGNNVHAYANLFGSNAYQAALGDFRADVTSPNTFDRTYDTALDPQANVNQQKAAVTQLFYMVNWLHDAFYDAGFDETARNAQTSNYGRGGRESDAIQAQAQDVSGRNNANMSTPSDGGTPVMRMYVYDGKGPARLVNNSAAGIQLTVGRAAFGPLAFDVTADLVRPEPLDGCTAFSNAAAVAGRTVLIDRGGCNFVVKAKNASDAGVASVVIANVATSADPSNALEMGAGDPPIPVVTVGSISVNLADGDALRAAVAAGTVNVRTQRVPGTSRDGTIDNGTIAHEWGHYISNRLVGNGSGLTTNQAGGLGEGWGDFHAQLLIVKGEDGLLAANANFSGAYASGYTEGSFVTLPSFIQLNNGYFNGTRRYPYSTDFGKTR